MGKANKSSTSKSASKSNPSSSSSSTPATKLKPATALNVRHILNEKHSVHLASLVALSEPGATFDAVARSHSEDKARQGGSLGWKVRGSLDAEFEKVAYGLEVSSGAASGERMKYGVVKTGFGWHIILVEGRR